MKYEVTFKTVNGGKWTAVYVVDEADAMPFGDAEKQAMRTLEENQDMHSQIYKIEVW